MKRMVTVLIAILILLPTLLACNNSSTNETSASDAAVEGLSVALLGEYSIIYPYSTSSKEVVETIRLLQNTLKEKFGVRPTAKTDALGKGEEAGELEILIGRTNRAESLQFESEITRAEDYTIQVVGKKLVIMADSDKAIISAIKDVEIYVSELSDSSEFFYYTSASKTVLKDYAIGNVTIDESNLNDYTVVYTDNSWGKEMANVFCDELEERCGYSLNTAMDVDAKNVQKRIIIGNTIMTPSAASTLGEDKFYVGSENGDLYLYATSPSLTYSAMQKLFEIIESQRFVKNIKLELDDGEIGDTDNSLVAMTFNVWVGTITDKRAEHVVEMIRKYMPDTVGVQEASADWIKILNKGLLSDYGYVGIGRDENGSGEHSGIYFKKETLRVIDSGTKWMSSTPDVVSKVEGSICNRVFTYAVLERKSDGTKFMHVNTHTDHTSDDNVRLEQVKVLVDFVKNSEYKDLPLIISGDLNAVKGSASIQHILKSGMEDSLSKAFEEKEGYTYSTRVIDYILFSKDDFRIYEYAVDNHKYGSNDPSDHCPVIVRYEFK